MPGLWCDRTVHTLPHADTGRWQVTNDTEASCLHTSIPSSNLYPLLTNMTVSIVSFREFVESFQQITEPDASFGKSLNL